MRAAVASALASVAWAACAATPRPPVIGNQVDPGRPRLALIERPSPPARRYGTTTPTDFFVGARPRDPCRSEVHAALWRGHAAFLAEVATAITRDRRCAYALEPIVAAFAHSLDAEERGGCTAVREPMAARSWTVLATLATTHRRRAVALGNAAEALWREARRSGRPADWDATATAFARAEAAGDPEAARAARAARDNADAVRAYDAARARAR